MRTPSPRMLSQSVDLYRYAPVQDADAGVAASPYGVAYATGVACSIVPRDPTRTLDRLAERVAQKSLYTVTFAENRGLKCDDRIVWVDDLGTSRDLIVWGTENLAAQGGAFAVIAEERL